MKKFLFLLSILTVAITQVIYGQQGWIKDIPGPDREIAHDITATGDGNYALIFTASGGLGSGLDAGSYLMKIDNNGNILLLKNFSSDITGFYIDQIISANDNGYIISESIIDSNTGIYQPHLLKLNENGDEESSNFYLWDGNSDLHNDIRKIIKSSDGGYILSGTTKDPLSQDVISRFVRKVDSNFDEVWTFEPSANVLLYDVAETSDGGFGVGQVKVDSLGIPKTVILKLDENGIPIFETTITNFFFVSPSLVSDFDGGVIVSEINSGAAPNAVRVNQNGNVLWAKDITAVSQNAPPSLLTDIVSVSDGFIYSTNSPHPIFNSEDLLLVKLDFDGEIMWERLINAQEDSFYESCKAMVVTADNGIMGIGSFYNPFPVPASFIFKTDSTGQIYPNQLIGKIGNDEQPNCLIDPNEVELVNWFVTAQNNEHTYYTVTDSLGNYQISLDTGDYVLTIFPPNQYWEVCENNINVSVGSNEIITNDFPMEAAIECPWLLINTAFPTVRPCFDNNRYYIDYCNQGSETAEDAYVEIEIDSNLTYISSSINLSSQNNNTLTFNLGDIAIGMCGNFYIDFLLDCEVAIGESICLESHIYPDSFCMTNPNWNGAFVEVDVACQGSNIEFTIENTGTGNMQTTKEYMVVEDAILLIMSPFQLPAGQSNTFSVPSNGSTFHLIAEQAENAPGELFPTAWVEGCGANSTGDFSWGFVNQFSLGDKNPFEDTDCAIATSSFDPNDKQGFPLGYEAEHYIRPNTDLEYLIRFQNTGTDTAFTVVVRDEIATELEMTSIQVGAASHPFSWRIYGENKLEFTFNNIMLPDSNVNEAASHGFVEFKISQKEDLPLGTVINNQAAIYFDFNEPIITNETYHTLGENFITVSLQRPTVEDYSLKVRPNPLQDFAIFEMKKEIRDGVFELYDVSGKQVWEQKINGKQFKLHRNAALNSGIYFYKISEKGNAINSGKIIMN